MPTLRGGRLPLPRKRNRTHGNRPSKTVRAYTQTVAARASPDRQRRVHHGNVGPALSLRAQTIPLPKAVLLSTITYGLRRRTAGRLPDKRRASWQASKASLRSSESSFAT